MKKSFIQFLCIVFIQAATSYSLHQLIKTNDIEKLTSFLNTRNGESEDFNDKLNEKGAGGQTPLMYAVLQGNDKAVALLLAYGADVTIPEESGYTPLHGAGFQGRYNIVRMLLKHGLDPYDRHTDGFIPLHRACWGKEERHAETIKVFLKAGVSVNFLATNGQTCYDMIRASTHNVRSMSLVNKNGGVSGASMGAPNLKSVDKKATVGQAASTTSEEARYAQRLLENDSEL